MLIMNFEQRNVMEPVEPLGNTISGGGLVCAWGACQEGPISLQLLLLWVF